MALLMTDQYYGDIVRRLFLAGGALMLASLPLFQSFIPFPAFVSIFAVLVVALAAGFIAPREKWIIVANAAVAAIALVVFEYYAVASYFDAKLLFFAVNEALAVIFFVALYYAIKTVRGAFMRHAETSDDFALDMLKSRYAKGEIDTKEFEEKKKELEQ